MKKALILLLIICFIDELRAQDKRPVFIGIQPGITQEPFYEKGEFDVNITPFTFQIPITTRVDLRLTTLGNYHFGGETGFSDVGFQLVAPIFINKKVATNSKSGGIYLGPVYGFGRNLLNHHYTHTVAIEPGYMFPTEKSFSLTLGLQFGGSYFDYDSGPGKWGNHFGFKINLGFWVNSI